MIGDIHLAAGRLAEAKLAYDRQWQLDEEAAGSSRAVAVVRALGAQPSPTPGGPLDRARFWPVIAALGMDRGKLSAGLLVENASTLEPFSIERVAMVAAQITLLPPARAKPLIAPLLARYRKAMPVDAAISLAVGDTMLAAGIRGAADEAYTAALAALADEPSRDRLHAYRGLALARTGDAAKAAAASAKQLAAAMPELP